MKSIIQEENEEILKVLEETSKGAPLAEEVDEMEELEEGLEELGEKLQEVVSLAEDLERLADGMSGEISRVVGGQLGSYFIKTIERLGADSKSQPGAIGTLLKSLDRYKRQEESGPEERRPIDDIRDLRKKYDRKWLKAKVMEVQPSKYGKGMDVLFKLDQEDLPNLIQTDMVEADLKKGQTVKVTLYISAGGILIDKVK